MSVESNITETPATVTRAGEYKSAVFDGWAYVGGVPWRNTTTSFDASSDFAGLQGKVGTYSDLTQVTSGGRNAYNEVTHAKQVWAAPLYTVENIHRSKYYSYDLEVRSTGSASCGPERLSFAITRGSWSEHQNVALLRAVNKMQFGVADSGFNLPVFLGELRDLRTVITNLGKVFEPKRSWWSVDQWFRARPNKALLSRPISEIAKTIASANLFNNFAVQPFLADIEALMGAHQHILRQIDRLSSLKPVRVRASHVDYLNSDEFDGTNPAAYTKHTWKSSTTGKRVVRTWALVQYNWAALVEPPSRSSVMVDALNVNRPLTAAWELTPWSFLIDYFIDIGSFISQFEGKTVKVPYTILADGYSVKAEKRADVTCFLDKGMYNAQWQNHKTTTVTGSLHDIYYIRRKGPLPYGTLIYPELRLPNLKQAGNILSLLIANMR